MKKAIYLFFALAVLACQKASKIPIPDSELKPVFYAILQPGEKVKVEVYQNTIYNNDFVPVISDEISISVSDGTSNTILFKRKMPDAPNNNMGNVSAIFTDSLNELKIQEGKTYTMRAQYKDKIYNARTSVPISTLQFKEVSYQFTLTPSDPFSQPDSTIAASIRFKNNSDQNFYFYADLELVRSISDSLPFLFYSSAPLFKDLGSENGEVLRFGYSIYMANFSPISLSKYHFIRSTIKTLSFEAYQFYNLAHNASNGGNPFAEGYTTYTNIEGGALGVFGSATKSINYTPFKR